MGKAPTQGPNALNGYKTNTWTFKAHVRCVTPQNWFEYRFKCVVWMCNNSYIKYLLGISDLFINNYEEFQLWLVFLRYSTNMISISLHVVSCVTPILNPYCRVQIFYPTLSASLYIPQIKICHVFIYLIKMLDLCYFFISIFLLFKFRWFFN